MKYRSSINQVSICVSYVTYVLGMGAPWVAQVRFLHIAMLSMLGVTLLIYVAYLSPQVEFTSSVSLENRSHSNATSQTEATTTSKNDTTIKSNATSESAALPSAPVDHLDPDRGVAAEVIYESGHVDVNPDICREMGKNVRLLIAITSAPGHESARMAIRHTWGHYGQRRDVAVTFMLGSTANSSIDERIKQEQFVYGDIIRGKFIDTYDNLTLKTISMLEWVDNYCPKANFVLKTDDDMFINVSRLLAFIGRHNPQQRAIYGRLAKKWKPIRSKKSKYYISPRQYKPSLFPDFTTGPAYLLPARLAKELYTAALNHTYFKLEDVFVTGIVANSLKIKRIHATEFLNKRVPLTACSAQKGISIHMIKGPEQYDLWKKLLDGLTKCK